MSTVIKTAVVQTRAGAVRGSVVDGVQIFKGIPYAAPPFGANRLRPPEPTPPWTGVRDALTYGPKQPQPPYPPQVSAMLPELVSGGEDCLNLNIWSPDLAPAKHPVMVWIPGSAFQYGTAATTFYDGSRFARDGVTCVTINYRVSTDGFLALGDGIANCALLDQIAALRWVRENIAAFGGDPDNVTVFGESGGAMTIGMMLSMPRAEGLFRRAILESGGAHPFLSAASARRVGEILAEKLGVEATREAIAAVPIDQLLAAQVELSGEILTHPDPARWGEELMASQTIWQPVLDGDVIPERPIDRIRAGASAGVDLLVGSNRDEWRLFLALGGIIDLIPPEAVAGAAATYGLPVEATLEAYRAIHPNASPGDLLAALQGDWWCRIPAVRLADAHASNSSGATYMYEFAWRSPQFGGRLGASHALEIPFVFDTLGMGTEAGWGSQPPQSLADTMHAAWVAFASTGNPGPGWPAYDARRRATMRFDTTSVVVDDPLAAERKVWEAQQER